MKQPEWLAGRFEEHRGHLQAVAYRMLGSAAEADDAIQESWLRLSRAEDTEIDNLGGWLTTVVARVCLDMLRARRARREEPHGVRIPEELADPSGEKDPEQEVLLADSVGLALLIVLDTLAPAERTAFVLHDMFAVPFEDVGAFLAASRAGDFEALLELLDPDAELRADAAAAELGAAQLIRGATGVAEAFAGRAQVARLALVDGAAGAVWAPRGQLRVVFSFAVGGGKVLGIALLADPDRLRTMNLEYLDAG